MPIYEYRCEECRNHFEVLATSATNCAEVRCPKCDSARARKIISASSFRINSGASATPAGALSGCASKGGFS